MKGPNVSNLLLNGLKYMYLCICIMGAGEEGRQNVNMANLGKGQTYESSSMILATLGKFEII